MGIFATTVRRTGSPMASPAEPASSVGQGLRPRFEVLGEHLAQQRAVALVCAEVGRVLARDGADLGEALDGLRSTYAHVVGREPDYEAVRALCVAWGEESLQFVHQVSCEDPLTGLGTRGHLLARLEEVYRGSERSGVLATSTHALVVVEDPPGPVESAGLPGDELGRVLRLARVGNRIRSVFSGEETIGQVQARRLLTVVRRDDQLARRVVLLGELLAGPAPHTGRVRVWIEGLPASFAGGVRLLDELSRA